MIKNMLLKTILIALLVIPSVMFGGVEEAAAIDGTTDDITLGHIAPFLNAQDLGQFRRTSRKGQTIASERLAIVKANSALAGLPEEARTLYAQEIIKHGCPKNKAGNYIISVSLANKVYTDACRLFPTHDGLPEEIRAANTAIRTACLRELHTQITHHQAPFKAALERARTILADAAEDHLTILEKFNAEINPLIKMAIRVLWRLHNIDAENHNEDQNLDDVPMHIILQRPIVPSSNIWFSLNNSPTLDTLLFQMLIDLLITRNDTTYPVNGFILTLKNLNNYTELSIVSSRLIELFVSNNLLTTLAGINAPALTNFSAGDNQLTTLAGLNAPALTNFSADNNQLTSLAGLNTPALTHLNADNNQLTSLAGLNTPALTSFSARNNQLTSLAGLNTPLLTRLSASNNQLTTLTGLNSRSLCELYVMYNCLTPEAIAAFVKRPRLRTFKFDNQAPVPLTIAAANKVYTDTCRLFPTNDKIPAEKRAKNQFSRVGCLNMLHFKITHHQAPFKAALKRARTILAKAHGDRFAILEEFNAEINPLIKMAIRVIWRLQNIDAENHNEDQNLDDVPMHIMLQRSILPSGRICFSLNNAPTLDTLLFQMLIDLLMTRNDSTYPVNGFNLKLINLNNYTEFSIVSSKLTELNASNNQLTSLAGLSAPSLTRLFADNNQLTSLAGLNAPSLTRLFVSNNRLTSLAGLNAPSLAFLNAPNNQLTTLEELNTPELTELNAFNNRLTTLAGLNAPSLTDLNVYTNRLTTLAGLNAPALTTLDASNNRLSPEAIAAFIPPAGLVDFYIDNQTPVAPAIAADATAD